MNKHSNFLQHPWTVIDLLKVYFLSAILIFAFFSVLMLTFDLDFKNPYFIFWNNTIFHLILVFFTLYVIKKQYKLNLKLALNLHTSKNFRLLWCSLIGICLAAVAIFTPQFRTSISPAQKNLANEGVILISMFSGIFIIPLCEEIFWRGFVFPAIREQLSLVHSIAIVSILFSALHIFKLWGAWDVIISIFILSIVLTTIRALTNSTLSSIVTHVAYNTGITVLSAVIAFVT